jgi:hypothetical protein
MKSRIYAWALFAAILALTMGTAMAQGETNSTESKITITSASFVAPSPEKENLDGEWVEVANQGDADENLAGWALSDEQNHTYTFPDFVLAAGASVKIHTGSGSDTDKDLYWSRTSSVWNNSGDLATLLDAAGNVVARYPEESKGA